MKTTAYKCFTHDLCSPIQGGPPVFDGKLPHVLPTTTVDASDRECSFGWNACLSAAKALEIAGLWPNGRPSRLFRVETDAEVFTRGNKTRAATWTITEEVTDVRPHVLAMSSQWFSDFSEEMTDQQTLWRAALARPEKKPAEVEACLREALQRRGLNWNLKQFNKLSDLWEAREAWAAWEAREAREARAAWEARAWARAAREAWAAWEAREAREAWAAWEAREAREAREALQVYYAARRGWTKNKDPLLLTAGLRPAYFNGLALAVPVGNDTLGWRL